MLQIGFQRHAEQARADAQQEQQHAGPDEAARDRRAPASNSWCGTVNSSSEIQRHAERAERQDAQLDVVARPDAGQHAARRRRRRSAPGAAGSWPIRRAPPPFGGELIDVELGQRADRIEERDAQRDAEQRQIAGQRLQVAPRLLRRIPGKLARRDRPAAVR